MAVSSYTSGSEIMAMYPKMVQTTGITPTALEFFVDLAEAEINGVLSRVYTIPFSCGWYPLEPVRTIARLLSAHGFLRSQITQEDPSRSDWVTQLRDRAEKMLSSIVSGDMLVIAYADNPALATIVTPRTLMKDQVWSSTAAFKPTMDLRDPTRQRVSRTRLIDERDKDLADSGGAGGLGSGDI